jgi:hypothetical protein
MMAEIPLKQSSLAEVVMSEGKEGEQMPPLAEGFAFHIFYHISVQILQNLRSESARGIIGDSQMVHYI